MREKIERLEWLSSVRFGCLVGCTFEHLGHAAMLWALVIMTYAG